MKRICFRKNDKAQVLGLPMYLIIIMIVAIAVIAAVIFMMPKGTQKIKAEVTTGFLISSAPGTGGDEITISGSGTITVTDMDGNPISSARVTLTEAGVSWSGTTGSDGTVSFSISPTLPENIDRLYVTMRVKADGYDDFEDLNAIEVTRIY